MTTFAKSLLWVVFFSLLATACSQRRFIPSSSGAILEGSFFDYPYSSITIKKAKFRYENGSQTLSGLSSFYLKSDSAFFFTASVLGMEAVRGILSPDSLLLLSRAEQTFYKSSAAVFSSLAGFPFSPALFFPLFSGIASEQLLLEKGFSPVSYGSKKALFRDVSGRYSIEWLFSGRGTGLTGALFSDLENKRQCQIALSDFKLVSGYRIPTTIRFIVSGQSFPTNPELLLQVQEVVFNENRTLQLIKPKSYHEELFR